MKKKLLCVAGLSVVSMTALAGRPFTTDDAGVLGAGECELESYYHRDTAPDTPAVKGWWVQPGCGYGLRSQMSLGFGRDSAEGEHVDSYALLGKTWLKEFSDDSYGIAIGYSAGWARLPGESRRFDTTAFNGIVSVPVGPLMLHANLGWSRSRIDETNATTWGLLAEWEGLLGPLDAGIETFGDDHQAPWIQFGLRWPVIKDRMNIDASWGKQTGDTQGKVWTLGLKFMF